MNKNIIVKFSFLSALLLITITAIIFYSLKINITLIYYVPVILFISFSYLLFLLYKSNYKYKASFELLERNIKDNIEGKFVPVDITNEFNEGMKDFTEMYNSLIINFRDTSSDIDNKLKGFIGYSNKSINDVSPLVETKLVISDLFDLYQFKKQIELDNSKKEIFNRLSEIFKNKFNLNNFTIFEIDKGNNKYRVIIEEGELYCKNQLDISCNECRCSRISKDVHTIKYHKSCPLFEKEDKFHYCINLNLSENKSIIINFVFEKEDNLKELKQNILFVKSFINEAIPSIEVKNLMEVLKESAFTDTLTNLYNRKFLEEYSKKLIPQVLRDNKNVGVLILDMDHFKAVNDEYGHNIGDKVLKELSKIIIESIRESDVAIRYGGEEFLILLVDVNSKEDAYNVAEKIRKKVRDNEIDVYAGNKLKKTVSIGLAMFPNDGKSLENTIKNADIALYEAKNSGRDSVVTFSEEQVSSIDLF